MKWQIVPEHREEFLKKNIQPTRRVRHFPSSGPNSPANAFGAVAQTERLMGVMGQSGTPVHNRKLSRSVTPPLASFPVATESYTPDRGPRGPFVQTSNLPDANEANTLESANSEGLTPTFNRGAGHLRPPQASANPGPEGMRAGAFNSPPTLTSTSYDGPHGMHLFTPLVPRQKPLAAVQSTCKAPSFYAKELFSSPAPFWKYVDIGSTPARLPDLSPYKPIRDDDVDNDPDKNKDSTDEDEASNGEETDLEEKPSGEVPQPSSPPVLDAGGVSSGAEADASPTRTVSRPTSRSVSSSHTTMQHVLKLSPAALGVVAVTADATSTTPSRQPPTMIAQEKSTTPSGYPQLPAMLGITANGAGALGPKGYGRQETSDDEDGEIDLSR